MLQNLRKHWVPAAAMVIGLAVLWNLGTVKQAISQGIQTVKILSGSVTADTELPAAGALADGTANPTVPGVASFPHLWNGTTWDRAQAGVLGRCERAELTYVAINQTGNTQLVTGTASQRVYICSLHLVTATAQNIALVDGTGSTCGTGTAGVEGFGGATAATGWNLAANGGIVLPATLQAYGRTTTNADNVCLFQSGAGQVSGGLTYVSLAP